MDPRPIGITYDNEAWDYQLAGKYQQIHVHKPHPGVVKLPA
jgi:hypothetical protein